MLRIGCHLSSSAGYLHMGKQALSIGANTFQFFTRNPRGSKAKQIDTEDVAAFLEFVRENNFTKIIAHAPYTLNPCSADTRTREFAFEVMSDDMARLEYTPYNYYDFHPGSHGGQGIEAGIELTSDILNKILNPGQTTIVLIETMSGKGSEIGGSFEDIKKIIDRIKLKEKVGVCLDTCHIYDAGYDIVNNLDGVLQQFNNIIGLDKLYAVHLNDSKYPIGARKDRHEKIGQGTLGIDAIINVINHPLLRDLPFLLETPNKVEGFEAEIKLLRSAYKWQP